ncbi:hypothetical protein EW145_g1103 [Phellinidium pouzarii]|uniref:Small ribosomal subunit protein mS29 n=1 Tax=Phellinidium pouzarii TaxID=167371 RepID=A0A4V3XDR5_9AGAM|nr:hypothetical protein EW145_g1103 [Phellinidium pouzarii]
MMKTFGLPRNMLVDFRLLSTPCSVSRKVTASLIERLDLAAGNSSKDDRLILTGPSGCGKSYLMLQAVSYCSINDWIVLYIPRGQKLVDSSTSYFYDPRTQLYLQPVASSQILQRLLIVNRRIIEQLKVTQTVTFEKHDSVITGAPLKDLIEIAVSEQHLAPTILSAVLTELGKQKMYPVLLAIDEFQTLYCKTSYRDQHYNTIRSFHLSLPRLLMEYASGKKVFSRGAVLGALSPTLTNYPLPPELQKVITPDNLPNPYTKLVPGLVEYSQGLETFPVPEKLDYNEAAALFEIWKKDSSFHTTVTDEFFLSKYTESSGNARDFVHRGLLATLIT